MHYRLVPEGELARDTPLERELLERMAHTSFAQPHYPLRELFVVEALMGAYAGRARVLHSRAGILVALHTEGLNMAPSRKSWKR